MSFENQFGTGREERLQVKSLMAEHAGEIDAELAQTLKNFRNSVHAWSEAELSRPRTGHIEVRRRGWRLAAGWALGCALVAGGVSGAMYERRHQAELARINAQRQAEQQRQLAVEQAQRAEEELAKVDRDVQRDVPSAMKPLAELMNTDSSE